MKRNGHHKRCGIVEFGNDFRTFLKAEEVSLFAVLHKIIAFLERSQTEREREFVCVCVCVCVRTHVYTHTQVVNSQRCGL